MSDDSKALTVFDTLKQINVHDMDRKRRVELGMQVLEVLPVKGIIKDPLNALSYALYVNSLGLNPLRREMYGWEDKKGNLQLQDPYDLKVTWARKRCEFDEWHQFVSHEEVGGEDGDIVCKVWVLRRDRMDDLKFFVDLFGRDEAIDRIATVAYGVVGLDDQFYRYDWVNNRPVLREPKRWEPKAPPSTWTWHMVARKRGLSNALKISHGTPSTEDIKRLSWESAGGMDVLPSDWQDVTGAGYVGEHEAMLAAEARERQERLDSMSQQEQVEHHKQALERGRAVLHGEDVQNGEIVAQAKPVELPEEFDELVVKLTELSSEHGDGHEIVDGKARFLIQRVFEKLGLGRPDWNQKLTVAQISGQLREFVTEEKDEPTDESIDDTDAPEDGGDGAETTEQDPGQEPGQEPE